MPLRLISLSVLVCILAGCASSSAGVDKSYYLLRANAQIASGPQDVPARVGISRVLLASYLEQPGIVVLRDGNKVVSGRQHMWAEPLESGLRDYMRDALTARVGYPVSADAARRLAWKYRLDIDIDQLHGTLDGTVHLVAGWAIIRTDTDTEVSRYRFAETLQQQADGYDSLVAGEIQLLSQLADAIATSLEAAIKD